MRVPLLVFLLLLSPVVAEATIAVTSLDSGSVTTNHIMTTNSVSPASGTLLLLFVGLNTTGCETSATVSGLSITWTSIGRSASANATARGWSAISAGNTGTITVTFGGANATCVATLWTLLGVTGADTTNAQGIAATHTTATGSGSHASPATCSLSMGTYASSGNATIGAWMLQAGASGATFTADADTGWANSTAVNIATGTFATQWLISKGSDTSSDGTFTWTGANSTAICITVEIQAPAQSSTTLWFSGGEAGNDRTANFAPIEVSGPNCASTPTAVAGGSQTRSGGYGIQAVVGRCMRQQTPTNPMTVYFRGWFKMVGIAGGPPGASVTIICLGQQSLGSSCLDIQINTSRKVIFGSATGTTTINDSTWYEIEAKGVVDAVVGGVEVKINGNVEINSFTTDSSAFVSFGYVEIGPFEGGAGIVEMDYDDMMICSGSYCPTGGVSVARQGTSGTPTYNAWTKNSCTGGTIDGCWSDTGYDTTKTATDAVANDAQTMLIHGFETTQSGHGTETIANHDTINACKTAAVMKSGTASAPVSIRRRLNGADTDTSKTLTTSDAYYDDGIWTIGGDKLAAAAVPEIGMVHGSGSATDTVYDMWLMCDYLAVTVPLRHRVTQDGN